MKIVNEKSLSPDINKWSISAYSRATEHLEDKELYLENMRDCTLIAIKVSNGWKDVFIEIGQIRTQITNESDQSTTLILLQSIYNVLKLDMSMISVQKLMKLEFMLNFKLN